MMKTLSITLIAIFSLATLSGCGDSPQTESKPQDHVWKAQTDSLDKAKAVEGMLQDAAQQQRQKIDELNK